MKFLDYEIVEERGGTGVFHSGLPCVVRTFDFLEEAEKNRKSKLGNGRMLTERDSPQVNVLGFHIQ